MDADLFKAVQHQAETHLNAAVTKNSNYAHAAEEFALAVNPQPQQQPGSEEGHMRSKTSVKDLGKRIMESQRMKNVLQKAILIIKQSLSLDYEQHLINDLVCHVRTMSAMSKSEIIDLQRATVTWHDNQLAFFELYPDLLLAVLRLRVRTYIDSMNLYFKLREWVAMVIEGIPFIGPSLTSLVSELLVAALRDAIEGGFEQVFKHASPDTIRNWFLLPAMLTMESYLPVTPVTAEKNSEPVQTKAS